MMEDIAKIKNDEWLETDGLGGFASGTVSGIRTRHYHARLLTTADPPSGRVVLVNVFGAWTETEGESYFLTSQLYDPQIYDPQKERPLLCRKVASLNWLPGRDSNPRPIG